MEKRNEEITVVKSAEPEKLVVAHASSFKDEIRFYVNEKQYVSATEKDDEGISVELWEEVKKEVPKKAKTKKESMTKENFKVFLKLFSLLGLIMATLMMVAIIISVLVKSFLVYLISINIAFFAFDIIRVVILETRITHPSLKSKHSAEHMMVNFLETNKRLPKNMQEIKKSSRFSYECGSRRLIQGIAEEFLAKILATIIAVISSSIYLTFFDNLIIDLIIFLSVYFLTIFISYRLLRKHGKMGFLVNPIKKVLTIIAQCGNTTKKVEEKDIYLAYCAAKEWMKIVYPEFYNEDEDVFLKNCPY